MRSGIKTSWHGGDCAPLLLQRDQCTWLYLHVRHIVADGRTDGNIADCTCSICWCCSWSCASGSLSNFAGGVLILLMKPFVIGDYIVQGNTEGTVKEIGLVYTELITADNRLIVIPNGTLIDSSIVNVTATGKRRLELSVGIGYKSDLKKAKEVLIRLGENDPARDPENPVNVFVSELAESSVNLGLHVWVSSSEYWNAKWRLTENIKLAFDEEGIEIPFKQVEISVTKM